MSENLNETIQEAVPEVPSEPVAPTPAPAPTPVTPASTNAMFEERPVMPKVVSRLPMYVPAFVLGIISIVFSMFIALVGDICGIIGISLAVSRRWEYNVTAGLICSIVGLVLPILSHALVILMMMSA